MEYETREWVITIIRNDKKIQLIRFNLPEQYENTNIEAADYFLKNKLKHGETVDSGFVHNAEDITPIDIVFDMERR